MAQVNYIQRVKASGFGCLMSLTCSICYPKGIRNPFFGVQPNGRTIMGNRAVDRQFQREIWLACKSHLLEAHGVQMTFNAKGAWVRKSGNGK